MTKQNNKRLRTSCGEKSDGRQAMLVSKTQKCKSAVKWGECSAELLHREGKRRVTPPTTTPRWR